MKEVHKLAKMKTGGGIKLIQNALSLKENKFCMERTERCLNQAFGLQKTKSVLIKSTCADKCFTIASAN